MAPRDVAGETGMALDAWLVLVCLDDFGINLAKFLTSWVVTECIPVCSGMVVFNDTTFPEQLKRELHHLLQRCPQEMWRGFLGTTS